MKSLIKITEKIGINTETQDSFWSSPGFLLLLIFILNTFLVYPIFFPNLSEIGLFDESVYINNGRLLAEGRLTPYAGNPLVSFLYAIIYLPIQTSPFWLIHACGIGRFVLFCFLWLSAYLTAKQLRSLAHPLIMVGCLFVSPVVTNLIGNPSDALFSAMSCLVFWQLLSFYKSKEISHLWFASVFLGLATLSRNDGLALILISIIIGVALTLFLKPRIAMTVRRLWLTLVAGFIPFGAIVGGYLLLYGFVTGDFEPGIARRSYVAFEQGQGVAYRHLHNNENPFVEGQREARKLFGSPSENQHSVIKAIFRNPRAFFQRVKKIAKKAPKQLVDVYGHELGLLFSIFAGMGILELIRKKLYLLLSIMLLWPLHLLIYFAFFFRNEYFLFPFFVVFLLSSVGLASMVCNAAQSRDHCTWLIVLVLLAILGMLFNKAGLFVTPMVIAIGLLLVKAILTKYPYVMGVKWIGYTVILSVALILRGGFLSPEFRSLGDDPPERAGLFMRENLKPRARVGAYAPGTVWIADMTYVPMHSNLRGLDTDGAFSTWIEDQKCEAIYVNDFLKNWEPSVYKLIQGRIGKELRVAFTTKDKGIQVLFVEGAY